MCYNNHYVPQFILRNFGIKINVFDCLSRSINCQEEIQQSYVSYGMYPDEVERLLSEKIETLVAPILSRICAGFTDLSFTEEMLIKKFAFTGYLRSTRKELRNNDADRVELLLQVLRSDSFRVALHSDNSELLNRVNVMQNFIYGSRLCIKKRTGDDSFIISDVGPVFNNLRIPTFASLVISPDVALFFHIIDLANEDVVYSNSLTLEQCERFITYRSINELSGTFSELQVAKPELNRYMSLMNEVIRHNGIKPDFLEVSPEQNKILSDLEAPNKMRQLIVKPWSEGEVSNLIALRDYEKLSALIIFNRFAIVHIPSLDRWHYCFRDVSDEHLYDNVRRFSDNAHCEFDKCIAALSTEILAERGHPEAAEKIGRLYKDGKHVPVNEAKSRMYYEMSARNGNCDAISQMIKQACKDGDEQSAMMYLAQSETPCGGHYSILASYKESNGDISGAIELYTKAAKLRYLGAFAPLFRILLRRNLIEQVEELIPIALSIRASALSLVVDYYYRMSETDISSRGKLYRLIEKMQYCGMREASSMRCRYGIELKPKVSPEELDALKHLVEVSDLYCKVLCGKGIVNGPLAEAKESLEKIIRKVEVMA